MLCFSQLKDTMGKKDNDKEFLASLTKIEFVPKSSTHQEEYATLVCELFLRLDKILNLQTTLLKTGLKDKVNKAEDLIELTLDSLLYLLNR